jgi:hypothetical protein
VVPVSDSDDITTRLDRMKKLCDELEAAQGDVRKLHRLIERMRAEANLFRQHLATNDPAR